MKLSKEEYSRLKQMVSSSNSSDILLAGPLILELRNSKQLKRRQVNELFVIMLQYSRGFIGSTFSKAVGRDYKHWKITNIQYKNNIIPILTFKWKWLNGEL